MFAVVNWEDNTSTAENIKGLVGEDKSVGGKVMKQFESKFYNGQIESLHSKSSFSLIL